MKTYEANVFFPGCLGPLRREVVLADDASIRVKALRMALESLILFTKPSKSNAAALNNAHAVLQEIQDV